MRQFRNNLSNTILVYIISMKVENNEKETDPETFERLEHISNEFPLTSTTFRQGLLYKKSDRLDT